MKNQTFYLNTLTLLGSLIISSICFAEFDYTSAYVRSQSESSTYGIGFPLMLKSTQAESAVETLFPVGGVGLDAASIYLRDNPIADDLSFGMNLNTFKGTTSTSAANSFQDQFSGQYPFNYSFFTNKLQSNLFQFSDCKNTCDRKLSNCGWGPLTEAALKSRLNKCGLTMANLSLEPVIVDELGIVSCHSLNVQDPTALDKLAEVISYDCIDQKREGENDANFCGCILKKAANPKDKFFSPLTLEQKSRIAAMTQFDQFQKKTAEIQSGLFQVSKILAAAIHDSDTQDLFEGDDNSSKACLPGSFRAIGTKFTTVKQADGKLMCGEQGSHRLNAFFKKTVLDCAGKPNCSKEWRNIARARKRITNNDPSEPATIFDFLQHQSVREYKSVYQQGSRPDGSGGASDEEIEKVVMDVFNGRKELCTKNPDDLDVAAKQRYNEICQGQESMAMPAANLSYLQTLVTFVDEYRSNDKFKNIDDYVEHLSESASDRDSMSNIRREMMKEYQVLKVGVFENHANQKSAFAKIISLVDNSLPEGVNLDINTSIGLNKAAADIDIGFKEVKRQVAKDAMVACQEYLTSLAVTCKQMDQKPEDMIKNKPSAYDLTHFSPSGAAEMFQQDTQKLGSLAPTTTEGLRRKFELYRCGNLMRDPKLNSLAFESEGIDLESFKDVFKSVTDNSLQEGLASKIDVTKDVRTVNIYAEDDKGFLRTLKDSGESDLEEFGRVIGKIKNNSSYTGDLKSLSDSRLGTPQGNADIPLTDQDSTLNSIAEMAKKTLAPSGNDGGASKMSSFNSEANYASSLSSFNKEKLKDEESKLSKDKNAADDRLDVIAKRLADLMESKKKNDDARASKEKTADSDSLGQDPKYQEMLIEKLKLEKEIASLGVEKSRKLKAKKEFEQKLSAIESEKEEKAKQAQKVAASNIKSAASKSKKTSKGGSGSSGTGRKIASIGSGSSASGGGSSSGPSAPTDSTTDYAAYVITLTQDQVTAIKQKFQVVENPNNWVSGGKPPVIREGNIFYELAVEDGRIIVPFKKKPLNGFNVAGLRVPASDKEPLPMKVDKKDVERRRAARVQELNALLDSK
jgi:methyl coenzyme M reductase subunit C-like uncharacterized protein (methanogenesis marker protein 7)/uncharacterized membrane protein YgcG